MCSVVILHRPGTDYPVLVGANRDEMVGRPWRRPGRHWDDRPNVVAALDDLAGGSWLGINDEGVLAAVLNRRGTLGPAEGKRSRGELVLEALDHADAVLAARALSALDPSAYRPFNLVVLDNRDGFVLSGLGEGRILVRPLPEGLTMVTASDPDDPADPRIGRYRRRFSEARPPDPVKDDWSGWERLLADRDHGPGTDVRAAMSFMTPEGFGTSSSALIALPSIERPDLPPVWRFAAGRPGEVPWETVELG